MIEVVQTYLMSCGESPDASRPSSGQEHFALARCSCWHDSHVPLGHHRHHLALVSHVQGPGVAQEEQVEQKDLLLEFP